MIYNPINIKEIKKSLFKINDYLIKNNINIINIGRLTDQKIKY